MQYFIDANIFLRVLVKDNEKQFSACVRFLKTLKKNKFDAYTGSITLAEIAWTLGSYYSFSKQQVIEGIDSILNLRGLKIIDDYNHKLALDLYQKYSVKYIDSLIASIGPVYTKKMIVVSYDKDFDKLPVVRKEPNRT
ncbi:PIN domain-containing protein [Candidatus Roizmanbacteria bacterium]|nr:PIN domain-containing protein [Candidatus Roizmanbacteria bacterium]